MGLAPMYERSMCVLLLAPGLNLPVLSISSPNNQTAACSIGGATAPLSNLELPHIPNLQSKRNRNSHIEQIYFQGALEHVVF